MQPKNEFRIIPALDRYPALVRFAQTHVGRALVLLCFALLLLVNGDWQKLVLPLALVPVTFLPTRRRLFVAALTLLALCARPAPSIVHQFASAQELGAHSMRLLAIGCTIAAVALCGSYVYLANTKAGSFLTKWPVATPLVLFVVTISAIAAAPLPDGALKIVVWSLTLAVGRNLWFLCYSMKNRRPREAKDLLVEVGTYNPVWCGVQGSPCTPLPKSGSFLDRIEAKSPEALAICQLKGLKLILWAMILAVVRDVIRNLAYGTPSFVSSLVSLPNLGIPSFGEAMTRSATSMPYPFYTNWLALIANFTTVKLLDAAVIFHIAIGICRLAGFQALRGIYRPLDATSFADFWNRVHFYFKELLVEFFFFPTFLSCFRSHPRLRMVVATFAAAFFGNWFYHFVRDIDQLAFHDFGTLLAKWQTYAVYCFLLALGIGISQLHGRADRRVVASPLRRFTTMGMILGCYALLSILDDGQAHSLTDCGRFFLHLFPAPTF